MSKKTSAPQRLCASLAFIILSVSTHADEGIDFFEAKIRPVLVDHCYECHSADAENLKGGLFVDSRAGLLDGGDSGPSVAPGDVEGSLLIEAIRYRNEDLEMPPKQQLPAETIADFEKWIAMGAPDPREKPANAKTYRNVLYTDAEAASHWAFQPIANPEPPAIDDPWIATPIDAFILRDLRDAGLEPSPPADSRVLLRRLSYTLTGLPPGEEVDGLTFAQAVETLLDSDQYGVHWGRHWLDIARYSDHTGLRSAPTAPTPTYPHAWTYRDWVIDAFNADMPYDRFVIAQIAGDRIGEPAGVGFCRVGKAFGQNLNDRTNDRIDALTKGFLGLTVSCARCHDHKFDPVTQADYFALHGVFMSSEETEAMLHNTEGTPEHDAYAAERAAVIDDARAWARDKIDAHISAFVHQTAEFLLGAEKFRDGDLKETVPELAAREVGLQAIVFESWLKALEKWEKENEPALTPWFAFATLDPDEFPKRALEIGNQIADHNINGQPVDPLIARAFLNAAAPESLEDVAEIYGAIWVDMERTTGRRYPTTELIVNWRNLQRRWIAEEYDRFGVEPQQLPDPDKERLRQVLIGFEGPFGGQQMPPRMLLRTGAGDFRGRINNALHRAVEIDGEHPGAPVKAMTFRDLAKPIDSAIQIRGDANNLGEIVPRRYFGFFSEGKPEPFADGSGRLELAHAIVGPENPLAARVIVNRVWQWHFGQGLVADASDFGLRSEPPTHPELLDWLATWFVENGWSMKKLHRLILTSSCWRQSSFPRADGVERDPANTLLWRMNSRQLRFEEIRDTLLHVSGRLDPSIGGRPADAETDISRRSAFLYVNRYALPDMFQTFDFANPDFNTAKRESSIVPQQALFFLNSPWAMERANDVGKRIAAVEGGAEARIRGAFELIYGREPEDRELALAMKFIATDEPEIWARFAQALMQANEFVFVH